MALPTVPLDFPNTGDIACDRHGHSRFPSNINKSSKEKALPIRSDAHRKGIIGARQMKRRLETPPVHCLMAVYFIAHRSSHFRSIVQKFQRKKKSYFIVTTPPSPLCLLCLVIFFSDDETFIGQPKNCYWKNFLISL
ncbi:hypothetical protein CEXT_597001 [Caerostris extrusa]|uniref:Uncharacterized protein n=1 Tax=Caerostris extrusa TaxID=172846 RepID=A0AAV4UI70_CAEEX|nr:hypothetical protein CEXT_597001 [Caerostris extrusa]